MDGLHGSVHDTHVLGLSKKHVSKDVPLSMPAKMYHEPQVYQLERRAIFSKRWFLVSHRARYAKRGDFVLYEMAGFSFVVLKSKGERILAFHNICRYAFPTPLNMLSNSCECCND